MIYDILGLTQAFVKDWLSDDDCIMASTSGSTGIPKHIWLKKSDMRLSAEATCNFFCLDHNSHLLLPLSVDYIAGKMMIIRSLSINADLTVLQPAIDPFKDAKLPTCIDLVAIVPSQISSLIEASSRCLFRNVIIGGAPLSPTQQQQLIDSAINAWATYGMTETCSHVALRHISKPLYVAIPGFNFGSDTRGCLTIEHVSMSFGSLQTNDVVRIVSPTEFEWLGRYDNVINSGGIKIHPEIDEALLSSVIDVNFYIASHPDERWGQVPLLVLEGKDNGKAELYLQNAAKLLPKYHAPKSAVWMPRFVRTASGKVKRTINIQWQ